MFCRLRERQPGACRISRRGRAYVEGAYEPKLGLGRRLPRAALSLCTTADCRCIWRGLHAQTCSPTACHEGPIKPLRTCLAILTLRAAGRDYQMNWGDQSWQAGKGKGLRAAFPRGREQGSARMHTEARTEMEIDASWLSSPDGSNWRALLEFSRAAVKSLAFDYQGRAQEIHVLKIRRAFEDLRAPQLCKYGLKLLSLVGEVQELPGGYWVLAPYRLVPLSDSGFVFVGALPIEELAARYGDVRYEGLGRLVASYGRGLESVPIQSLEAWAGVDHISPASTVDELRRHHTQNGGLAAQSESIEYLKLSPKAPQVEWVRSPSALKGIGLAICRDRTPFGHRYFAGTLEGRRLTKESPLPRALTELIPGLAAASSAPLKIQMTTAANDLMVSSKELLPWSLFKVVTLLARSRRRSARATQYTFNPELVRQLKGLMEAIGYNVEMVA